MQECMVIKTIYDIYIFCILSYSNLLQISKCGIMTFLSLYNIIQEGYILQNIYFFLFDFVWHKYINLFQN